MIIWYINYTGRREWIKADPATIKHVRDLLEFRDIYGHLHYLR